MVAFSIPDRRATEQRLVDAAELALARIGRPAQEHRRTVRQQRRDERRCEPPNSRKPTSETPSTSAVSFQRHER
jgi:hypothetical protein